MVIEHRQAALCLFRRARGVLLVEVVDPRTGELLRGETLELTEANGRRLRIVWRSAEAGEGAPPTSPAMLPELLERILG